MKQLFYIIILISLLSSCNIDEGPFYEQKPVDTTVVLSFGTDIQPIFNSYCINCHTASHSKLNLLSCCSYNDLFVNGFKAPYIDTLQPDKSILYQYLLGIPTIMPPSGAIPSYEKELILTWIKQGAKNN